MSQPTADQRGIKKALFIENVEEFMKEQKEPTNIIIDGFQKQFSAYKNTERRLQMAKESLKLKLPEIQKTLDSIRFLKEKKGQDLTTNYELTNGVYATGKINNTGNVYLWLGANVMVEYPVDEAIVLLENNMASATTKLAETEEDLDFVADQIVITQVSMARIHNWDVVKRRKGAQ